MLKTSQISEDEENSSETSENNHSTVYNQTLISDFGLSYKSYQFLQRLSLGAQFIRQEPIEFILFHLCQVSKSLNLSELEIVWFGIYLSRFGWTDYDYSLENVLNFTAFATKSVLNENCDGIEQDLQKDFPGFLEEYRTWFGKNKHLLNIGYFELNSKYEELSYVKPDNDERTAIDYNFYVSQLLESNNNIKQED
ncbi:unnamed protein product [Blepharisma stoltei]|uniref:Uncharacterized protein n=1 Tax=Blepharisma stoltei TaxID=1481888 RepID=A0AAU9IT95_9CILI|nr:unnamed protein product [Blepharisma stoltei]